MPKKPKEKMISWTESQELASAARAEGRKAGYEECLAKFALWGTDGCKNCEGGRVTLYSEKSGMCFGCTARASSVEALTAQKKEGGE